MKFYKVQLYQYNCHCQWHQLWVFSIVKKVYNFFEKTNGTEYFKHFWNLKLRSFLPVQKHISSGNLFYTRQAIKPPKLNAGAVFHPQSISFLSWSHQSLLTSSQFNKKEDLRVKPVLLYDIITLIKKGLWI